MKKHKDEQINHMEMERKDTEPNVIQPAEDIGKEQNERLSQSITNKTVDKRELCKQIQKQETLIVMRLGWISRKLDRLC